MEFHNTRLSNGLQIIAETSPSMHSAALGFFVRTGARDEWPEIAGISHFLEHMVFKGTPRHSADDVNRIFDELGANYNASTGEEQTIFYAAVLPEYVPTTLDLLADILRPSLRQEDFDMEKKVILEEIGMYNDQPTHVLYENIMQRYFAGHPLGHSVLGSTDSVAAITSEQMRDYHAQRYAAGNIILTAAGKFDWHELVDLAEKHCGAWPAGDPVRLLQPTKPQAGFDVIPHNTITQQHVMILTPAPSATDRLRYAADILSVIVGDDSGSRIFWEMIDPGFVETADLGYNEYDGCGAFMCYFGCRPEEVTDNLDRIQKIFDTVNRDGVTEAELSQAKSKTLSRIVLRSERPMGRLGSLGQNWQYRGNYESVDDELRHLRAITLEDIRQLLEIYPLSTATTLAIGPREAIDWKPAT